MKKLMFISLLVIPFCKAADPDQRWYEAVQNRPDWQQLGILSLIGKELQAIPGNLIAPNLKELILDCNEIQDIPDNLTLPNLEELYLANNHIYYVNPQIFHQFPRLNYLHLNQNPLTPENVDDLKLAAQQANRNITIIADDIGDEYLAPDSGPGIRIKPAKQK